MLALRRQWRPSLGPVLALIPVLVIIGYPLLLLAYQSLFGAGRFDAAPFRSLFEGQTGLAVVHTLVVSAAATILAVAFGAPVALLAQRSNLPLRRLLGYLLFLPLLIPPFVQALACLQAYARGGLSTRWFGFSVEWLQGPVGVIALLALQSYPLVYLLTGAALSAQTGSALEEAARISGAGQWRCCWNITLPRLAPAVLAGALLAFVSSSSDFGIPAILGVPAGFTVVTTVIYRELSLPGAADALADVIALSALLAVMAIVAVVFAVRLSAGSVAAPISRRSSPIMSLRLGRWRWAIAACLALVSVAAILLPLIALLLSSVEPGFIPVLAPDLWTLRHFGDAFAHGGFDALLHSAILAAGAGAVVAVGGAALAAATRTPGLLARAIEGLTVIPFALPGSVIAVAAILAWQHWLYGTLDIILLAYILRFSIFGVRSAKVALAQIPEELRHAARLSGANPWRALILVERPVIQSAALAAFALTFLLAIHELTISSLLYTPQTETIAVKVLDSQQAGDASLTAALAVAVLTLTVVASLPVVLSGRVRRLLGIDLAV